MDTIKAQLLRIQQQLTGLSVSQKMLTASLLAIMVMTIVWWMRFAGTAELEAVFDQSLPPAEIGQIQASLASAGIPATVVGDRVMVPADRKLQAVALLSFNNALPSTGGASAWDDMMKMMSPWDTSPKTQAIQNHLRETMLSQAMTQFIPGIAKANVIINFVSERRVGATLEPSASVQITTRNGSERNLRALIEGVASTVASAVPGLNKARVSIIIDGFPHHAHEDKDGFAGGDIYEQIAQLEKSNADKITSLLPDGSLVAVKVDIETASTQATRESYDEKTTLVKEKSSESMTQETTSPPAQSNEPGAVPNTGLSLGASSSAPGPSQTMEKNHSDNVVLPGRTMETINRPAGRSTVVSAAVRIPRSYFVRKYKASNSTTAAATAKEPDDAALQPLVDAMLPRCRKIVQTCVDIRSEDAISIDMWDDFDRPLLGTTEANIASASGVGAMLGGHAKELALGVLAVISLFMVSMIVKKGPQVPIVVEPMGPRETPHLESTEDLAGIVGGEINPSLDAMELDEDSVKAQQVVEQVATMVKEDPDAAANLVKRWLNRT